MSYQEFNNLNIFNNGGQNSHGMMAAGIGVTISVLLRSIVGFMYVNISQIWLVIMFLLGFVAVIALRLSISKKLKHPAFNQNSTQKVMLIPSFKNMILVVFCYFMFLFFSIAPIQMIFDDNQNIFGYIGWLVTLFLFTIMNIVSISDRKVHAKTKNIGRQVK